MSYQRTLFAIAHCLFAFVSGSVLRAETGYDKTVQPLLSQYCFQCHGAKKQKGERRFDLLDGNIPDSNVLADYQDILDQLNLGDMPPEDAAQPTTADRQHAIAWLTRRIQRYHAKAGANQRDTVLRRLNAREYKHTVRDLCKINIQTFDPTRTFPKDDTIEHLDNNGDTLVTSSFLLSRYLTTADQVITKAMGSRTPPKPQTWTFRDNLHQQPEIDQVHRKTNRFQHMTLFDVIGADKHEGAYGPIHAFAEGVPVDGYYQIQFKAQALNRNHDYPDEFLGTDRKQPFRVGIRPGNVRAGKLHLPQPVEPLLADITITDEPDVYTVKVWLDKGFTPRFTFRNGLMDARSLWGKIVRKFPERFPEKVSSGIVAARFNAIKHGKIPQVRIDDIEIRGPLMGQGPTESQIALLGADCETILKTGQMNDLQMRTQIARFASRAYRRPVRDPEVDRIMSVVRARKQEGRGSLDAFADGLKTVLCSPNFLYLDEGKTQKLSAHALATRLSYFLWATMPDQRLRRLADDGSILAQGVLDSEIDRMLKDPRSNEMITGFLDSWLTFRDLGSAPPDRGDFGNYYRHHLGPAQYTETQMFVRHLIDENLSIANFIDSDFTFANQALAKLYGFKTPTAHGFQKVKINDPRRGGLLGMSSVLTVTANGIDTSPVVRGVWLLENFLGTPPSPPPPDIEPLDPDVRGAKTIRDQLEKHRNVSSCNECHRKIDPLGFALENFDAIGRWRNSYGRSSKIDSSGKLPGGQSFKDIVGLKQIMMQQKDRFAKALAEKMLAYAIGRKLSATDRPDIDRILDELKQRKWGMRDLIHQVVLSDAFQEI